MAEFIPEIIEQHAEEAAFLWTQRANAVCAPHYLLSDLARLDDRVEAHIDGLRVNGEPAWELVKLAAQGGDTGAVFAAAILALEGGKQDRIAFVLEAGSAGAQAARDLVSALGWLPYHHVAPLVRKLCASENSAASRRVGIAAAAVHRQDPGVALTRALVAADPLQQARACRAVGELGKGGARNAIKQHLKASDPHVGYWAAWAGALVYADPMAVAALQAIAEQGGRFAEDAARLVVRRLDPLRARSWWRQLAAKTGRLRVAIAAAGAAGDPAAVPWLIQQMATPETARGAGEALSLITGVRIANDKLQGSKPDFFEAGPTDDPADEHVDMDPDDGLAWPNPVAVEQWWGKRKDSFSAGTRYLVGKSMTIPSLREVLNTGYQRQRAAAAVELAIRQPGLPLFEVRAPGFRQKQVMGILLEVPSEGVMASQGAPVVEGGGEAIQLGLAGNAEILESNSRRRKAG